MRPEIIMLKVAGLIALGLAIYGLNTGEMPNDTFFPNSRRDKNPISFWFEWSCCIFIAIMLLFPKAMSPVLKYLEPVFDFFKF